MARFTLIEETRISTSAQTTITSIPTQRDLKRRRVKHRRTEIEGEESDSDSEDDEKSSNKSTKTKVEPNQEKALAPPPAELKSAANVSITLTFSDEFISVEESTATTISKFENGATDQVTTETAAASSASTNGLGKSLSLSTSTLESGSFSTIVRTSSSSDSNRILSTTTSSTFVTATLGGGAAAASESSPPNPHPAGLTVPAISVIAVISFGAMISCLYLFLRYCPPIRNRLGIFFVAGRSGPRKELEVDDDDNTPDHSRNNSLNGIPMGGVATTTHVEDVNSNNRQDGTNAVQGNNLSSIAAVPIPPPATISAPETTVTNGRRHRIFRARRISPTAPLNGRQQPRGLRSSLRSVLTGPFRRSAIVNENTPRDQIDVLPLYTVTMNQRPPTFASTAPQLPAITTSSPLPSIQPQQQTTDRYRPQPLPLRIHTDVSLPSPQSRSLGLSANPPTPQYAIVRGNGANQPQFVPVLSPAPAPRSARTPRSGPASATTPSSAVGPNNATNTSLPLPTAPRPAHAIPATMNINNTNGTRMSDSSTEGPRPPSYATYATQSTSHLGVAGTENGWRLPPTTRGLGRLSDLNFASGQGQSDGPNRISGSTSSGAEGTTPNGSGIGNIKPQNDDDDDNNLEQVDRGLMSRSSSRLRIVNPDPSVSSPEPEVDQITSKAPAHQPQHQHFFSIPNTDINMIHEYDPNVNISNNNRFSVISAVSAMSETSNVSGLSTGKIDQDLFPVPNGGGSRSGSAQDLHLMSPVSPITQTRASENARP